MTEPKKFGKGAAYPEDVKIPEDQQQKVDNNKEGQQEQQSDYKYNPLWNTLSKKIEGFEIPDFVKTGKFEDGKIEDDILLDTILEHIEVEPEIKTVEPEILKDPFVNRYMTERQKQDFDIAKYAKNLADEFSIDTIPTDDYLKKYYTEQNEKDKKGWTSEDIDKHITGMSPIAKDELAISLKSQEKTAKMQEYTKFNEVQQTENLKKAQLVYEDQEKKVEEMLGKAKKFTDISGVKIDQAKLENHIKNFRNYFVPGQDGQRPIDKLLNPENLFKMTYLLDQDGATLRSYITNTKESVKREIEERLGLSSSIQDKGTGEGVASGPDYKKWSTPE